METKGIAIGCFEEAEYKEEQVCLAASNKLYVFSDGVYEITYKNDHEMTLEDFTNIVSKQFNKTDALQSDLIYKEIKKLKKNEGPLDDDFSIVELIINHS